MYQIKFAINVQFVFQFHHRDPHLVGLLASDKIPQDRIIYYGMISDGIHGHGAAIRIAYRTHPKGAEGKFKYVLELIIKL